MFLLSLSLTMSAMFFFMKHPLSMGFVLLIQSILVALITGTFNLNFWYSYIMFLVMVGGMLVLFIYMTSIASNEKFKTSNNLTILAGFILASSLISFMLKEKFESFIKFTSLDMIMMPSEKAWTLSLTKFINFPTNMILLMIIIYLFIALVAVVKITDSSYGALRQKF